MSIQFCCPPDESLKRSYDAQALLCKALADPHRAAILAALARAGEVCVCDFVDGLPLNQPAVSQHLKILKDARLGRGESRGTWVYYSLLPNERERIAGALEHLLPQKVFA